jgi:hypothetical protein
MDITPTMRDYAKLVRWVAIGSSLDEDRKIVLALAVDLDRTVDELDPQQKDIDIIAR